MAAAHDDCKHFQAPISTDARPTPSVSTPGACSLQLAGSRRRLTVGQVSTTCHVGASPRHLIRGCFTPRWLTCWLLSLFIVSFSCRFSSPFSEILSLSDPSLFLSFIFVFFLIQSCIVIFVVVFLVMVVERVVEMVMERVVEMVVEIPKIVIFV